MKKALKYFDQLFDLDEIFETVVKVLLVVCSLAIYALFSGILVFFLWNWLLPDLFDFPVITFLQAIGISFLCGILFSNGK